MTGFTYSGPPLLATQYSGGSSGRVDWSYNNDLRVQSRSINGAGAIAFAYDKDGLLTKAGSQTLVHDLQNGRPRGAQLGSVTDAYTYNNFGELSSHTMRLLDPQYF